MKNYAQYIYLDGEYRKVAGKGGSSVDSLITSITWAELKALRDNSQLIPGMHYRITDFVTTCAEAAFGSGKAQSAGHPFDIIVLATKENELSEEAKATTHEGDTYFANSNLSAWELKYCLDNTDIRFNWRLPVSFTNSLEETYWYRAPYLDNTGDSNYPIAWKAIQTEETDTVFTATENISSGDSCYDIDGVEEFYIGEIYEEGKGIIYYMKDEWNNECAYDFKNIQFKRFKVTSAPKTPELEGMYFGTIQDGACGITGQYDSWEVDDTDWIWVYTFHNLDNNSDDSLTGENARGNIIKENNRSCSKSLDNFGTTGGQTGRYKLNDIVFYEKCYNNFIEQNSYSSTFGRECSSNTFGNSCSRNTFGNYCYDNTFGNSCSHNTFGNNCYSNTFGDCCDQNTFGNNCYSNTFGDCCDQNIFGNYCYYNTFGNYCYYNTFGNYCNYNTFDNNCYDNTFAQDLCRYITLENGCKYLNITCADSYADWGNQLQNIHIHEGVCGPSEHNPLIIEVEDRNLSYLTTYERTESKKIIIGD